MRFEVLKAVNTDFKFRICYKVSAGIFECKYCAYSRTACWYM